MDDILLNKVSTIERCINRVKEEYNEKDFAKNYTKQDSVILNIQRACEAAIDMGTHIVRVRSLGIPQSTREIFAVLAQSNLIPEELCVKLQKMVGFRNIAVHDYQRVNLDIVAAIVENNLNDLLTFSHLALGLK